MSDPKYERPPKKDNAPLAGEAEVGAGNRSKDDTKQRDKKLMFEPIRASELLKATRGYRLRNWSVIPIRVATKIPTVKWKEYQNIPATLDQIGAWFTDPQVGGVAVVLGQVSGGLCCRDFDQPGSYEAWAVAHPDLAKVLPTSRTARGHHVFYIAAEAHRTQFTTDGEIRGDGGFVLLPPSIHPSGVVYEWLIPLTDDCVPTIDVVAAGLLPPKNAVPARLDFEKNARATNQYRPPITPIDPIDPKDPTDPIKETATQISTDPANPANPTNPTDPADPINPNSSFGVPMTPEEVIKESVITGRGQHDKHTLRLARGLKLNARISSADHAMGYFERWWGNGCRFVENDCPDLAWLKFRRAWDIAQIPLGVGVAQQVLARLHTLTEAPEAARYKGPRARLLVTALKEMGRLSGASPFALSAQMVGKALCVTSQMAHEYIVGLIADGLIRCPDRGLRGADGKGKARRLVWVGNVPPVSDERASNAN